MDIRRNDSFIAVLGGLRDGSVIVDPTIVEFPFFIEDNGKIVCSVYPAIVAESESEVVADKLSAIVALPTPPSTMKEARKMLPYVNNISLGTLFRSYEMETQEGMQTLTHNGTLRDLILSENGIKLDAEGRYTLQDAIDFIMKATGKDDIPETRPRSGAPRDKWDAAHSHQVVCRRATRVKTRRGGWVQWLDYDFE